jgi:hypothetical protein
MANRIEFNEFDYFDSSDDGSPLPTLNLEAGPGSPPATRTAAIEDKGLNSTLHPGTDGLSPKSSEASTIESSSTRRTGGTSSTKTSFSGGDVAMTDVKPDWQPDEFINEEVEEDHTFTLYPETVDPSAIENAFDVGVGQIPDQYVFNSASTSPGPFTSTATDIASPSTVPDEGLRRTGSGGAAAAASFHPNRAFSVSYFTRFFGLQDR